VKDKSHADLLVDIAKANEDFLFHAPDQVADVKIKMAKHHEVWPLRTKTYKRLLAQRFHETLDKAPGGQALNDALNVLEGNALFKGPERDVHVRLAEFDGVTYLDLCNDQWEAVRIDAEDWKVVADPPVYLRRPPGVSWLPHPARDGNIQELRDFIPVEDADWLLLIGHTIGALKPHGAYAVLELLGQQGSARQPPRA
jgi:hypothetical protein